MYKIHHSLSSAEASFCWEASEKEKGRARGTMGRGKGAHFLFYRDTQREPLRRRERLRCIF